MPFGLQTDPQVTTIVGNDVRLTCRASKYIYSHLVWYYPSSEMAPSDSVVKKTDNYSISLTLVMTNVTKEQSGIYRCGAQNQHNSTDTLEQTTQLHVRGKCCQWDGGGDTRAEMLGICYCLGRLSKPCPAFRIIEPFHLEKTSRSLSPTINLTPP